MKFQRDRIRSDKKKNTMPLLHSDCGFTLAELLIVVAIIGVLVAISIPIFSNQLEKSRDAVTIQNLRAAYSEAAAQYILDEKSQDINASDNDGKHVVSVKIHNVESKGKKEGFT